MCNEDIVESKNRLIAVSQHLEKDSEYLANRHFNLSVRWSKYHFYLGISSVLFTGIATILVFNNILISAGSFAIVSITLTIILTFLNPSKRSETHKIASRQYLALRNQTRLFRELEIEEYKDLSTVKKRFLELAASRDEINQNSPSIPYY